MKLCGRCKEVKPCSEFYPRRDRCGGNGLQARCKTCIKAVSKEYVVKHPERVRAWKLVSERARRLRAGAKVRQYRTAEESAELNRIYGRERYHAWATHKLVMAGIKVWRQRNPERVREYGAKQKVLRAKAKCAWADADKIRTFYAKAIRLTAETGIAYHVDHVVPLRGKTVCGLHNEFNLQVLTASENCAKQNKFHGVPA